MSTDLIKMVVTLNVGQGSLALFKRLSRELVDAIESEEPSTLEYEWVLDEATGTCYITESYPGSEVMLSHLDSVGPRLGPILELAPVTQFLVFGSVSAQASAVLSTLGATVVPLHAGFRR